MIGVKPECRVATLRAQRYLDLVAPIDVVNWAAEELAVGADSANLAWLAGLRGDTCEEVDLALSDLAAEMGLPEPDERREGLLAARDVVRRMFRHLLTPYEAASDIWVIAHRAPAAEPELRTFIAHASEWEDAPAFRSECEESILVDGRSLLNRNVD